jgi:hypothetical protein
VLSESARMSSAAEARFRIQRPAPTARAVQVISLHTASDPDIATLIQGVPATDLVVMVVPAGADARAAATIGRVCSDRRVMTTSIVIRTASTTDRALSTTLAQVRPWSLMVVVASDEAYVDDIVTSFR